MEWQIALKSDNTSACGAANEVVAYIKAMRFALRVFICVFRRYRVHFSLLHVGTRAIAFLTTLV